MQAAATVYCHRVLKNHESRTSAVRNFGVCHNTAVPKLESGNPECALDQIVSEAELKQELRQQSLRWSLECKYPELRLVIPLQHSLQANQLPLLDL